MARTPRRNTAAVAITLRPEVNVIQSGVAEVTRHRPGGGVVNQLVMTSLDDSGRKWVSLRDICIVCNVTPPTRVAQDDVIWPVYFSHCDETRAGINLAMLDEFFNRISYSKRNRFVIFEAILSYWSEWFSKEGRSVHPMHEAYAYLLNSTVEPALEAFIETYEYALREDRPEGLTAMVLYDTCYVRLLRCIGQTVHVDFEDLTPAELTRLMSVLSTFSMMLLTAVSSGISEEDHADPLKLMSNIINQIYRSLYDYNSRVEVIEEILVDCYPDFPGVNEIGYT